MPEITHAGPRTVMTCVVDGCDWEYDTTPPPPSDLLVAAYLANPDAVIRQLRQAEEDAAQDHMDGHTAFEFLTTIANRDRKLNVARTLLAPDDWARVERS